MLRQSTADVESVVKAVMEQKKVCLLCNEVPGPEEEREANTKWRNRGIAPNDLSDHPKSES